MAKTTLSIPLTKLEKIFTVFALLFFADPIALFQFLGDRLLNGSNFRTLLFPVVTYFSLFFIVIRRQRILEILKRNRFIFIPIVLLLAYVLFSALWSFAPASTLRRTAYLFIGMIFGLYFTTRFEPEEQVKSVAWACGVAALLSVLFYFAFPFYGTMGGKELIIGGGEEALAGTMRGIFIHKNALGRAMAIGSIALFCVANDLRKQRSQWIVWAGFILSIALIIACESATSLCVSAACLLLIPIYRGLRWRSQILSIVYIVLIIIVGTLLVFAASNFESLVDVLGKDVTLTGRTDLWQAVIGEIGKEPFFGYGYRAYWRGWNGPSVYMWLQFPWLPPHAHNGFLDVCLDLGLIGLFIFLAGYAIIYLRALYWAKHTRTMAGLFPLVFLSFFIFINLTESSMIRENIYWFLYISVFSLYEFEDASVEEDSLIEVDSLIKVDL